MAPHRLTSLFLLNFFSSTEARSPDEVLGVQDHHPRELHFGVDGAHPAAVQAHLPGRRRPAVPGADQDDPPLDPPADREGQVQTVRQGKRGSFLFVISSVSHHQCTKISPFFGTVLLTLTLNLSFSLYHFAY